MYVTYYISMLKAMYPLHVTGYVMRYGTGYVDGSKG